MLPCPEGSQTCDQQRRRDPAHAGRRRRLRVPRRADARRFGDRREGRRTLGYKPQWTTIGNNVTNTVAKFYTNAKDNYDGAYGVDIAFTDSTPAAAGCNQIAVAGGAEEFPNGLRRLRLHRRHVHPDAVARQGDRSGRRPDRPGVGDRRAADSWSRSLMIAGPQGSLSKEKHDAGTAVFLSRYSAAPSSSNRSTTASRSGRPRRLRTVVTSPSPIRRRRRRARGGGARGRDPADAKRPSCPRCCSPTPSSRASTTTRCRCARRCASAARGRSRSSACSGASQLMDGGVFNVLAPDIQKSLRRLRRGARRDRRRDRRAVRPRRDPDVVAVGPHVAQAARSRSRCRSGR